MTRSTLEMDGIYTEKDKNDRFFIMKPCASCGKYNKQDLRVGDKPCIFCKGSMGLPSNYWYSLRTFREDRKLSAADRKKMGA